MTYADVCKKIECGADRVEAWAGSPVGIVLFCLWWLFMPELSVDIANYGISVFTALLLVLTIGATRRDRIAMQVKLDDLERAIEPANDELIRLEEKTEKEIQLIRDQDK